MVKKQNSELNLAKFIFSILIVMFHSNRFVPKGGTPVVPGGWVGTEFFFIVSGYLMAISSKKFDGKPVGRSTYDFLIKKIKGLYPFYIVAFIFTFAVRQFIFALNGSIKNTIVNDILLSINEVLLLQGSGIKLGSTHNGPTWYISVMIIAMTILFPLLLKFKDWYTNIGSLTISIFVYAFIAQYNTTIASVDWLHITTIGVLRAIAAISLGVFIYGLVNKVKNKNFAFTKTGRTLFLLSEIGAYSLLFWVIVNLNSLRGKHQFDYIMVIILVYICFVIFSELTQINNILPEKICSFLGRLSLPIYLFHRVLIHFLLGINVTFSYKKYLVIYLAAIVVLVTLAMLFLHICRLIRKKFGSKAYKLLVETNKD